MSTVTDLLLIAAVGSAALAFFWLGLKVFLPWTAWIADAIYRWVVNTWCKKRGIPYHLPPSHRPWE